MCLVVVVVVEGYDGLIWVQFFYVFVECVFELVLCGDVVCVFVGLVLVVGYQQFEVDDFGVGGVILCFVIEGD